MSLIMTISGMWIYNQVLFMCNETNSNPPTGIPTTTTRRI